MGWFKKFFKKWVAPIVGIAVGIFAFPVVGLMGAVAAGAAAAAVTQVGISMVTSAFDVPDYSANTADGASAKNSGILINKVGTNNAIPVVYGRRKIGGSRVYVSTNGTNNEDLFVVMVFCEGTINAVKKLFIDNNLVADASDLVITGNTPGPITNSDYSAGSRLTYELTRGNGSTPAWFTNAGASAGGWTGNHECVSLVTGFFQFKWVRPTPTDSQAAQQSTVDANPYKGGIPVIQIELEGKKTPDASSYVDGASTAYASMPTIYSTNPADHILDYLMNDEFGRNLENDRIGFTSFKTAKAKFDTTVTYQNNTTGKILELNQVIQTNRTMLENVQTMLQNARSGMPYVQGKFNLKLLDTGHATTPTGSPDIAFPVTERELIGGLVLEGLGHRDQYNQIKAVFPNPETNWEIDEVVYPKVNSATDITLLAEDNGRRMTKEISLEGVTNPNIAGDIASIVLLRSRKKKMASFTATAELHDTVVGDIITITYPSLGMSAAQFRITSHQITADYTVQITALEHDPTNYDFTNTDVYIPNPVYMSSTNPNANGGQIVPGNPIIPGPTQNAYISAVGSNPAQIFTGFTLTKLKYELTVVWATDQTQYVQAVVDYGTSGSTSNMPQYPIAIKQIQSYDFSTNPVRVDVTLDLTQKYHWFRIRYITLSGNDVVGPWKYTTNPAAPSGQLNVP